MAKNKKTKKEEVVIEEQPLEPIGEIKMAEPKKINDCEWCFQFDNDEPQIFAWTDDGINSEDEPTVTFTIKNTENAYISFSNDDGSKVFRIFAREITELGKKQRENQKEVENASKNKED